jgi:hypothetical protein
MRTCAKSRVCRRPSKSFREPLLPMTAPRTPADTASAPAVNSRYRSAPYEPLADEWQSCTGVAVGLIRARISHGWRACGMKPVASDDIDRIRRYQRRCRLNRNSKRPKQHHGGRYQSLLFLMASISAYWCRTCRHRRRYGSDRSRLRAGTGSGYRRGRAAPRWPQPRAAERAGNCARQALLPGAPCRPVPLP